VIQNIKLDTFSKVFKQFIFRFAMYRELAIKIYTYVFKYMAIRGDKCKPTWGKMHRSLAQLQNSKQS
jgi:hypothetical protein